MSNEQVQPRWKRRADEIADAIGDELSVTVLAPVEIGNEIKLHSDTITALANALPSAADIAEQIWTWNNGTRQVRITNLAQDPVHVEVRNVQNGFTAMAADIASALRTSALPVKTLSGDTVDVKTATNQSVTVVGSVNASVGNVSVPITTNANGEALDTNGNVVKVPVNGNNLPAVNVANGNNITVPVRATAAGVPQNSSGIGIYIPAKTVANDPSKLANSSGSAVNVGVDVASSSVPVKVVTGTTMGADSGGNAVEVPVSNQNLPNVLVKTLATDNTLAANAAGAAVTVPANWSSAGILDVNVKEINSTALTSTTLDVNTTSASKTGVITSSSGGLQSGFTVTDDNGTVHSSVYVLLGQVLQHASTGFQGKRVYFVGTYSGTTKWQLTDDYVDALKGVVLAWNSSVSGTHNDWIIQTDDGAVHDLQKIWDGPLAPRGSHDNHSSYRGRRVYKQPVGRYTTEVTTETDWWGVADWILEPIEDEASVRYGFIHGNNQSNATTWSWFVAIDNSQADTALIHRFWDPREPSAISNDVIASSANLAKYVGARVANYKNSLGEWGDFWQLVRDAP